IGVSVQTGAVVTSWSAIKQGKYGLDVRGADFYRILGRDDLVKKYRRRQAIRFGVGFGTSAAGLALASVGTAVLASNLFAAPPDFGYDDPLQMGPTSAPTRVSITGAAVMSSVGFALFIGGMIFVAAFRPHPTDK